MTELGVSAPFPQPRDMKEADIFNTLTDFHNRLVAILNRGITFTENVDCVLVTLTSSATPDDSNTVNHTLGKIPNGYIVYYQNKAGSLYDGGTTWTNTAIYVKSNIASVTFKIIIF
jgi:hypothetical protein